MDVLTLFFEAKDYQRLKDIKLTHFSKDNGKSDIGMPTVNYGPGATTMSDEAKEERRNQIKNEILLDALNIIEDRINVGEIFIGRSLVRKKERISVFKNPEELITYESQINGVVGRLVVDLGKECSSYFSKADKIIVDITIHSRLDSQLFFKS